MLYLGDKPIGHSVGIIPTETLEIDRDGTYDVLNYASVEVSTGGGGDPTAENIAYMKFLDGVDGVWNGADIYESDTAYGIAEAYCQTLAQIIIGS